MVSIQLKIKAFPLTNEKVKEEIQRLFNSTTAITLRRECDECHDSIDAQTTKTIFECKKCKIKFDLCPKCQPL